MRTFNRFAAQGEITIHRVAPMGKTAGYSPLKAENGRFVIGHSETGHHHVIDADGAKVLVLDKPPEGMRILRAILQNPTVLEHQRPFDTHEPIMLEPGEYEIRIAREYNPYAELARQSVD